MIAQSTTRVYETSAGCLRSIYPTQPRHEAVFWWRHNGPVTSQLTDRIKWPNYPLELIGIYVHINTHNKESLTQRCRRSTNVQICWIFCIYLYGLSLNGWQALFRMFIGERDKKSTTPWLWKTHGGYNDSRPGGAFVAGIDLPHQGVEDYNSLVWGYTEREIRELN